MPMPNPTAMLNTSSKLRVKLTARDSLIRLRRKIWLSGSWIVIGSMRLQKELKRMMTIVHCKEKVAKFANSSLSLRNRS
jgi:hydroxyacyl-ACP dehydratase HTD2-like protein with hotdog domain